MFRTKTAALFAAAVTAAAAGGSAARAGLLPASDPSVNAEGGNYRWTYAIVLPTNMKLQSGNYFTVYDFGGYVAGGETAPDGWAFSASKVGPTPDRLTPTDNPDLWNLTWKYTGDTIPSGQIGLGNFWAISNVSTSASGSFTAETNRTSDGLVDRNITTTSVPVGSPGAAPGVPEPATLALAGLGLPLVGLTKLVRRRRTQK